MKPHIIALHNSIVKGNAVAAAQTARWLAINEARKAKRNYREAAEVRFFSDVSLPVIHAKDWTPPRGGSAAAAVMIGGAS